MMTIRAVWKRWGLPMVLGGLAVFAFAAGFGIRAFDASQSHDPGPRLFPWFLAMLLMVAAIWEAVQIARGGAPEDVEAAGSTDGSGPRALLMMAGLIGYAALVPVLGFLLITVVFSLGMMVWLGAKWRLATLSSLMILLAVYGLFVKLFKIQLPEGMLGLSL